VEPDQDTPPASALAETARPGPADLFRSSLRWETGLVIVVIAVLIAGGSVSPEFLTGANIFNLGLSYGEIAIMTLPMALIVISGEIDLSVASILGMSSAILGILWSDHWPMLAIFAVVAVVGALAGLFNGLLVTRLGLPSLAVTIGTLALYRGIALIILGPKTISTFPVTYTNLGVNTIPGTEFTYSTGIFIAAAVIFGVVLHFTPFGRSIYAMGASPDAARFAGIRVKRSKTILFVVSAWSARWRACCGRSACRPRCRTTASGWSWTSWPSSCSPGSRSSAARAP
jgi:rhamnose transport system permease protein